jgi:type VI secretion system FHA domain protein
MGPQPAAAGLPGPPRQGSPDPAMPLCLKVIRSSPETAGELSVEQRQREFTGCGGTIGRAPDNDWVLPDSRRFISSRHAIIDYQGGAYYLVDTSRNGVFVNGADTPVGQGHPQRLFDGDRLRLGDYEVGVSLVADADYIPDDGMRDSIVRAQMVQEEPSMELLLVAEDKLLQDSMLRRHLTPSSDVEAPERPPVLRTLAKPASKNPVQRRREPEPEVVSPPEAFATRPNMRAPSDIETRALAALLEGVGLAHEDLLGRTPRETLQLAGRLLRVVTGGLMDLMRERNQLLDTLGCNAKRGASNPLQLSNNVDDALRYLLGDRSDSKHPVSEEAVRSALRELRQHEQALLKAILEASRGYAEHFNPDALKTRFDRGMKRSGLLSGPGKFKYWELYEESYTALTQRDEGGPPQLFADEFNRAYGEEIEAPKPGQRPR